MNDGARPLGPERGVVLLPLRGTGQDEVDLFGFVDVGRVEYVRAEQKETEPDVLRMDMAVRADQFNEGMVVVVKVGRVGTAGLPPGKCMMRGGNRVECRPQRRRAVAGRACSAQMADRGYLGRLAVRYFTGAVAQARGEHADHGMIDIAERPGSRRRQRRYRVFGGGCRHADRSVALSMLKEISKRNIGDETRMAWRNQIVYKLRLHSMKIRLLSGRPLL